MALLWLREREVSAVRWGKRSLVGTGIQSAGPACHMANVPTSDRAYWIWAWCAKQSQVSDKMCTREKHAVMVSHREKQQC